MSAARWRKGASSESIDEADVCVNVKVGSAVRKSV